MSHDDRIDQRLRYGTIDPEYARRLATTSADEDGPVWMVNLVAYRERADYADGAESGLSGAEAVARYAPLEQLAAVGAEIVFMAEVERQLLGDSPIWNRVGVVKYPSRRAFLEMQQRPDFQARHEHKNAGVAESFVVGCQPFMVPPEPQVAWGDVPHPPTDDDPPVVIVHVLKYDEAGDTTPDDMIEYQQQAGEVASPEGVQVHGWFRCEGTIVGDGRTWDEIRFNAFPSSAAFYAIARDPRRLEAQRNHREVAIADTYTVMVRPALDRLAESVSGR